MIGSPVASVRRSGQPLSHAVVRNTSKHGLPRASSAENPVITSAARVINVTLKSRSTEKTPSEMFSTIVWSLLHRVESSLLLLTIDRRLSCYVKTRLTSRYRTRKTNQQAKEQPRDTMLRPQGSDPQHKSAQGSTRSQRGFAGHVRLPTCPLPVCCRATSRDSRPIAISRSSAPPSPPPRQIPLIYRPIGSIFPGVAR